MSKRINKDKQDAFLKLQLNEQIEILNEALKEYGTEGISKKLNFSYQWAQSIMQTKNVFYVGSLRKFVIAERNNSLNDKEITEIREIINDYERIKLNAQNKSDVNQCAGACKGETVTRSIIISKEVADELKKFSKQNDYISMKDIYTTAIKEFLAKYSQ